MNKDPSPRPSRNEALKIWLKLILLLAGLTGFGAAIFWLTRTLLTKH